MNSLPPVLFAFADLVLAHPEWEVSVLCQTLGVSTKTLARICGRILGLTPKQWLLSYRMRCWRVALQDQTDVLASALEHFGALSSAYRHAAHALGMSPASIRRGGAGAWLVFGSCQTPWGNLTVAQSDKGISWVCVQGNPESFAQELFDTYPKAQLIRMDHKFALGRCLTAALADVGARQRAAGNHALGAATAPFAAVRTQCAAANASLRFICTQITFSQSAPCPIPKHCNPLTSLRLQRWPRCGELVSSLCA